MRKLAKIALCWGCLGSPSVVWALPIDIAGWEGQFESRWSLQQHWRAQGLKAERSLYRGWEGWHALELQRDQWGLYLSARYWKQDPATLARGSVSRSFARQPGEYAEWLESYVFHHYQHGESDGLWRVGRQVVFGSSRFYAAPAGLINPQNRAEPFEPMVTPLAYRPLAAAWWEHHWSERWQSTLGVPLEWRSDQAAVCSGNKPSFVCNERFVSRHREQPSAADQGVVQLGYQTDSYGLVRLTAQRQMLSYALPDGDQWRVPRGINTVGVEWSQFARGGEEWSAALSRSNNFAVASKSGGWAERAVTRSVWRWQKTVDGIAPWQQLRWELEASTAHVQNADRSLWADTWSWGYRAKLAGDYHAFNGTLTPWLLWAHDVRGDGVNQEWVGRSHAWQLGLAWAHAQGPSVSLHRTQYSGQATRRGAASAWVMQLGFRL